MAEPLAIGRVVRLNSGGPSMTITSIGNTGTGTPSVWTVWITPDGTEKHGCYPVEAVEVVPSTPKGPLSPKTGVV